MEAVPPAKRPAAAASWRGPASPPTEGSHWEGEDRFRFLLEELPVGVLLQSPAAEILSSNPRALELLGLSEDQLLGRTSFHPDWNVIHEDGAPFPGPTHPVPQAIATRQPVRNVVMGVYRPATQDRVWLLVNAVPELAPDGSVQMVLCTFTDITERRLEEIRLHRSEELLRDTQRLAKVGGWEWDLATQTATWTEGLYRIHELKPDQRLERSGELVEGSLRCYAPEDRSMVLAAFRRCLERGEPYDLEFPFTTFQGRRIWVRTMAEATLVEGRVVKVSGHLIDITEQVRREEERRRMEAQLQQVQKMESLGLLAGGVAHDINNVLGSILAVATLHRRKAAEGTPLRRDMDTITQACLRGGSLTKSLQGFARKELGEERLLDLNDLIRAEVRLLARTVAGDIRITEDLGEGLQEIKGDPAALRHAIMSLCANAIEGMPRGGTLTLRTRNLGSEAVIVEVEDRGTGMPPEVLEQAMAPFFTTKQSSQGAGLGLSLVYGTVRAHRGTVELTSEPGRGTLVRLHFPTPGTGKGDSAEPGPSDAGAAPGKAILFVDDDPLILQSMPGLLECLGHSATTAASGEEALALIDQGCKPDLVILDVNMPGIGGLETLMRLRGRAATLPVLLSTGFASESLCELVKAHPEVHLIAKPFSLSELDRLIRVAAP